MKKITILGAIFIVLLLIVSCTNPNNPNIDNPDNPDNPDKPIVEDKEEIKLEVVSNDIFIKDEEIANYDFTKLFKITKIKGSESTNIPVDSSYLDLSNVNPNNQYSRIVLRYEDKKIYKDIEIVKTIYELTLSNDSLILKPSEVSNYNFIDLFTLTKDNEEIEIPLSAVTNNVENTPGNYEFIVDYKEQCKKINIQIIPEHYIDIIKAWGSLDIEIDKVKNLNLEKLFTLYVDGKSVNVTTSMLEYNLNNIQIGDERNIKLIYELDGVKEESLIKLSIVKNNEITVETKDITTYPNDLPVDLTSLFIIRDGNNIIDTPLENIEGNVNLSIPGDNDIILNYNGKQYHANVKVIHGVIITPINESNHIKVKLGTNQDTYPFINDFILKINGIRYRSIPNTYFEFNDLDFNKLGSYDVTLTIPYNDQKILLTGAKFTYISYTITYDVVPAIVDINLTNDFIYINKNTNLFDNIKVIVNNFDCNIIDKEENVTYIRNVYGKLLTNIDYNSTNKQTVLIEIYPYKDCQEPIIVNYDVIVNDGIEITSKDFIMYTFDEVYLLDLFEIKNKDQNINVKADMITGFVDTKTPGDYEVTLTYLGITKTSKITVYDSLMKGVFKTTLNTIGSTSDIDDEGYQIGEDIKPTRLSNFVINEDGTYSFGNRIVSVVESIDLNTQIIKIMNSNYYMYYNEGIIFLNPINDYHMKLSNSMRPYVFFSEKLYKITNHLELNSGSKYVIDNESSDVFSIDVFELTNVNTKEISYYALKVKLNSHYSADYFYTISAGYCTIDPDFKFGESLGGVLSFDENYKFNVTSTTSGKIERTSDTNTPYNGKVFTGNNGKDTLTLSVSTQGEISFRINGKNVASSTIYEVLQSKISYLDLDNDILFINSKDGINPYTYKIKINCEDNTISLLNGDKYIGKYINGNNYIYLNGFNQGYLSYSNKEYILDYSVIGNQMIITFVNDENIERIECFIPDIYNTLTVTHSTKSSFVDLVYENTTIYYGALVTYTKSVYGKNTSTDDIYENVKIITSNGELSTSEKVGNIPGTNIKYIDKSKVHFGKAGYYLLVVNIPVDNEIVSMNYTLQVVDTAVDIEEFKGIFSGLFNQKLLLNINEFGICSYIYDENEYIGLVEKNKNKYIINCFDSNNKQLQIICDKINRNTYSIWVSGSINMVDYVTRDQVKLYSSDKFVLYCFESLEQKTYLFGRSGSINLEVVELINNIDNYQVTFENKVITFKINEMNEINITNIEEI